MDFEDTSSLSRIRSFVQVNKTVTDFCCVLNFMAIHIHHIKHKMLQMMIEWKKNDKRVR